ncbi:glutamate 5-kinase [Membranihabitans marinus]|uniref:glutamate 5-kinase n=1 Tax=Membranihabitans marinus TaxID=1227546 RepID=UPI001F010EA5|nr:glutamate 5-kinase [Membranihabitans marinus]
MVNYRKVVIKIGSNVLTQSDGLPNLERMSHLTEQVVEWVEQGVQVVLVSSGAVAFGRSLNLSTDKKNSVANRQIWAATGQVKLIQAWQQRFEPSGIQCAQVMVTKEDFRDRLHYLNMRQCITHLIQHDVIPIINENDVVAVTELMFTDNDELAGLIASMVEADALFILTNVDGIYNGDPRHSDAQLLEDIDPLNFVVTDYISNEKSSFGRGGMITKANMAKKIAKLGIAVHIANGLKKDVLRNLLNENLIHTKIHPSKPTNGKKKWLAHAGHFTNGEVVVNHGAREALLSAKATSLLPVGVIAINHPFEKGDIIRVIDENGGVIGLGIAEYPSQKAEERMGLQQQKVLIHYDYLFLEDDAVEIE